MQDDSDNEEMYKISPMYMHYINQNRFLKNSKCCSILYFERIRNNFFVKSAAGLVLLADETPPRNLDDEDAAVRNHVAIR